MKYFIILLVMYISFLIFTASYIQSSNAPLEIFLATEDPKAVIAFQNNMPKNQNWNLYIDQYYYDTINYRNVSYEILNQNPLTSKKLKGRGGLLALGSLLVALESNDYVLTTCSQWSKLINDLRLFVLNPRCNNCTNLIDLRKTRFV